MAKTKANGVNKSAMVREILKTNPKMKVNEVVVMLAAKKVKVLPSQVYFIKSKLRSKRRQAMNQNVAKSTGITNPIELIRKVKALAGEVGGVRNLGLLVEAMQG